MEFDFETLVERSGANLKLMMTPPEVVKAGNISLDGAEPVSYTHLTLPTTPYV